MSMSSSIAMSNNAPHTTPPPPPPSEAYSPTVVRPTSLSAGAVVAIAAVACVLLVAAILYLRRVTRRLDAIAARNVKPPRVRLDPSAVASLPTFPYRANSGRGGALDQCAVCLSAMSDGDTVRRLPACGHEFHVKCIDTWLLNCATCPVCRSDVRPAGASFADQSSSPSSPPPPATATQALPV